MNVLSLFDGIGGARIALSQSNINLKKYFSSEIDSHAINVINQNYDDIIHLGDIKSINTKDLPKIDLLIGGSPCQDLSHALSGKGLKGERSGLFFNYLDLLNKIKPKYFLLENVKNKWANLMSSFVGVDYIEINSMHFTAQSRPRYYWTNIPMDISMIPSTPSKYILKNILEKNVDEKYFLDSKKTEMILKNISFNDEFKTPIKKLFTISRDFHKDNERQRRVYSIEGKSPTLLARSDTPKIYFEEKIRKLTPLECERLQGLPDNYTDSCSDTQRYKMIGNGFTVDVIKFFLSFIGNKPTKRNPVQNLNYQIESINKQMSLEAI